MEVVSGIARSVLSAMDIAGADHARDPGREREAGVESGVAIIAASSCRTFVGDTRMIDLIRAVSLLVCIAT